MVGRTQAWRPLPMDCCCCGREDMVSQSNKVERGLLSFCLSHTKKGVSALLIQLTPRFFLRSCSTEYNDNVSFRSYPYTSPHSSGESPLAMSGAP